MNKSVRKQNNSKQQKQVIKAQSIVKGKNQIYKQQQKKQIINIHQSHPVKQSNFTQSKYINIQNSVSQNKMIQKAKKRFRYSPSIQAQKSLSKIPARYLHNNHQHIATWTNLTNNALKSGYTINNNNSSKKIQIPSQYSSVVKIKETPYKGSKIQQKQKVTGIQKLRQIQKITQAEFEQNYQFNEQQNSSWIARLVNGIMDSDYESSKMQNLQKISQIQNRSDIYDLSQQEQDQRNSNCLQKNQFLPQNSQQKQMKQKHKYFQQQQDKSKNKKKNIENQQIYVQLKKNKLKDAGLRVPPATRASSIGDINSTGRNSSTTKRCQKNLINNQKLKGPESNFQNCKVLTEKDANIKQPKQNSCNIIDQTNKKNSVKQSTTPISQISSISPKPKKKNGSSQLKAPKFVQNLKRNSQIFQFVKVTENQQKGRKKAFSLNTTKQKADLAQRVQNGNFSKKQNRNQIVQNQIVNPYILMKGQLIKRLDFDSLFDDDNQNYQNSEDQHQKPSTQYKKTKNSIQLKNLLINHKVQNTKKVGGIKKNNKNQKAQNIIVSGRITKNFNNKNLDNFIQISSNSQQRSQEEQKQFGVLPDISSIAFNLSKHNINFSNDVQGELNGIYANSHKNSKCNHQQNEDFNKKKYAHNQNMNINESVTTITTANLSHRNKKNNQNCNYQNINCMRKNYLNCHQLQAKNQKFDQIDNKISLQTNKKQKQNEKRAINNINNETINLQNYEQNSTTRQLQNINTTRRLKYKYLNDQQHQFQDYTKNLNQNLQTKIHKQSQEKQNRQFKIQQNIYNGTNNVMIKSSSSAISSHIQVINKPSCENVKVNSNKRTNLNTFQKNKIKNLYLKMNKLYQSKICKNSNQQKKNNDTANPNYLDLSPQLNRQNLAIENLTNDELIEVGPIISKIKYENYQYVYEIFQLQYVMINRQCLQRGCYKQFSQVNCQFKGQQKLLQKQNQKQNQKDYKNMQLSENQQIDNLISLCRKPYLLKDEIQSQRNSAKNELNQIYQTFRQSLSTKKQLLQQKYMEMTSNNGLIIERLNLKLNNYINNHQLEATYRQLNLNLNFQQLKKNISINSFR